MLGNVFQVMCCSSWSCTTPARSLSHTAGISTSPSRQKQVSHQSLLFVIFPLWIDCCWVNIKFPQQVWHKFCRAWKSTLFYHKDTCYWNAKANLLLGFCNWWLMILMQNLEWCFILMVCCDFSWAGSRAEQESWLSCQHTSHAVWGEFFCNIMQAFGSA